MIVLYLRNCIQLINHNAKKGGCIVNEKKIVTHESLGQQIQKEGRVVNWVMTPDTTGGKYSSVCIASYEPGKRALPAHSHRNGEETIYVRTGTGKVLIGDEIEEIKPGTFFLLPQGVPHMVWNNGTTDLELVCFYAPGKEATTYDFHEDVDFPDFK
jgi:mannose-6-phosphate isomerase-like protein (cupin superfamily)